MQNSQTAQLPAASATGSNVVVQAVLAMALGLFVVGCFFSIRTIAVASRTSAPSTTPRTMSATPMRFPATNHRCRSFDLLFFRLSLPA